MISKGIRGAITVDKNTEDSIRDAVITLLKELIAKNNIEISKISHIIFTTTKDINAAFPAKFARVDLGFEKKEFVDEIISGVHVIFHLAGSIGRTSADRFRRDASEREARAAIFDRRRHVASDDGRNHPVREKISRLLPGRIPLDL